jgi:putative solute:sodium symporter small subunit
VVENRAMRDDARRQYWSRTKRLTAGLLLLWLVVNLAVPWFARELDGLHFFRFPLAYWLAAMGLLVLYLVILWVYVVAMDRIEAGYLDAVDAAGADSRVETR